MRRVSLIQVHAVKLRSCGNQESPTPAGSAMAGCHAVPHGCAATYHRNACLPHTVGCFMRALRERPTTTHYSRTSALTLSVAEPAADVTREPSRDRSVRSDRAAPRRAVAVRRGRFRRVASCSTCAPDRQHGCFSSRSGDRACMAATVAPM
ncbi:hypothetical protein MRX96_035566 [Rhipicephalus microplus]